MSIAHTFSFSKWLQEMSQYVKISLMIKVKENAMNKSKHFEQWQKICKSLLGGILIGIGGAIFVSVASSSNLKIIGALLFGFGLFFICHQGYYLFTGRIGYFFEYTKSEKLELIMTLICNIIGVCLVGMLLKLTNNSDAKEICNNMIVAKKQVSYFSFFIKAIFCGMMMILAVEGYKKFENGLAKIIAIFFAVIIFILAGFEHSIADIFYLSFASLKHLDLNIIIKMGLAILGNGIGSIALYYLMNVAKKPNKIVNTTTGQES